MRLFLLYLSLFFTGLFLTRCAERRAPAAVPTENGDTEKGIYLQVLGTAQDGGYPHAGCRRDCCRRVYEGQQAPATPVCLGIVDEVREKLYMLEAGPAFPEQWRRLQEQSGFTDKRIPDGIFLTHAHIGHYTGLMFLGREVMGSKQVPVYALPRMTAFLRENGPWSQLVALQNIELHTLQADSALTLPGDLRITPFRVPHRDEFSETAGFRIETPRKRVLFIPDIDKWEKWARDITAEVAGADLALLDATFYRDGELQGRAMSEVPHPFVEETMRLFDPQPAAEKKKVTFIHFNHTNPLLWDAAAREEVKKRGFGVALEGMRVPL
ncbi:MAG: MBL fold metallo-hydrolase [Saprospiraceae bacterium]